MWSFVLAFGKWWTFELLPAAWYFYFFHIHVSLV